MGTISSRRHELEILQSQLKTFLSFERCVNSSEGIQTSELYYYFQLKESLPPIHIPIPTPAPAQPLGDTSGRFRKSEKVRGHRFLIEHAMGKYHQII